MLTSPSFCNRTLDVQCSIKSKDIRLKLLKKKFQNKLISDLGLCEDLGIIRGNLVFLCSV